MKISELSTDRALDVLCELTPYVANITGDKALLDELGKKFDTKGKIVAEMYTFAAQKCAALAPVLLKAHRADIFGVLAVLNETSAEEIGKQNVGTTIKQIRELFQDRELLTFFKSWQQEEETK